MSTYDLDTFLFWTFRQITLLMGAIYQSSNPKTKEDPRRLIFDKQKEFLGQLKHVWRMQIQDEQDRLLKEYPFFDSIGNYCNHMDINYIRVCNCSADDLKKVISEYLHLYFKNEVQKPVLTIYSESSYQFVILLDKNMNLTRILQLTHFIALSAEKITSCAYLTLESKEERERVCIFKKEGNPDYDSIFLQVGIDTFRISIAAIDPNSQIKLIKNKQNDRYMIIPDSPRAEYETGVWDKDKLDNYSFTNPIIITP